MRATITKVVADLRVMVSSFRGNNFLFDRGSTPNVSVPHFAFIVMAEIIYHNETDCQDCMKGKMKGSKVETNDVRKTELAQTSRPEEREITLFLSLDLFKFFL